MIEWEAPKSAAREAEPESEIRKENREIGKRKMFYLRLSFLQLEGSLQMVWGLLRVEHQIRVICHGKIRVRTHKVLFYIQVRGLITEVWVDTPDYFLEAAVIFQLWNSGSVVCQPS